MSLPLRPLPPCPDLASPATMLPGAVWKALHPAELMNPDDRRLLGIVGYGSLPTGFAATPVPAAAIPMAALGPAAQVEAWYGRGPAEYGEADGVRFATDGEVLFGALSLPCAGIDAAAHEGYRRIIGTARGAGYPQLIRLWNYFPGINDDALGLERYKRFCLGRYQAFSETGYVFGEDLPAASAIGTEPGELWIYCVAARRPGRQIENPRQVSAYRYPLRYGPRSPSFSRAMLLEGRQGNTLFISGTASIVGHETLHAGDVAAQCRETLATVRAILAQAGLEDGADLGPRSSWKIYLRRPADYPLIRNLLERETWLGNSLLFLKGDICRRDLLLEIEGVANLPAGGGASRRTQRAP
jgi:chorismate lyase/3-hydroxybenzoate synthase